MAKEEIICDTQAVAVDVVIFTVIEDQLKVLLIKRAIAPKDIWAIPGGFVHKTEGLDAAAERELFEETGVKGVYLEQLYTFGEPKRDPRGRVISVSYFALVDDKQVELKFGSDAKDVGWFAVDDLPELAFDHKAILTYARQRLTWKLEYTNVIYSLLPRFFTLTDLQNAYEAILGYDLDKRNFRRKFLNTGLIVATGEKEIGAHRPAELFKFKKQESQYISNPFGKFLKK